ncbi:MAG: hypothetical protein GY941_29480 [Planctomycetes bacterium]|nr:hypothetical protein [Planctomycetota bacterium]
MDDWIVITHARWKLRSAVCTENETLNLLKVEQPQDKTFIGRAERGFDFLGYFIKPGVSRGTFERFTERISRLYEHGADYVCIGEYVRHWLKWVWAVIEVHRGALKHWGTGRASPPPAPLDQWFLKHIVSTFVCKMTIFNMFIYHPMFTVTFLRSSEIVNVKNICIIS